MNNPSDLSLRGTYNFILINLSNNHIRNRRRMTAEEAVHINSFNHLEGIGYKWMSDDQGSFLHKLVYDPKSPL